MAIYKLKKDPDTGVVNQVIFTDPSDSTHKLNVPFDTLNGQYQDYLEWVALGNTAEEAD
tara:strand:- start:320 stop:496 length:177 start_codon:yes stop_codon:yes gene_type:complete